MWVKAHISLGEDEGLLSVGLIKWHQQQLVQDAQTLVQNARDQAEAIIAQAEWDAAERLASARQESDRLTQEAVAMAEQEVWDRADRLFQSLEQEREIWCQQVEQAAVRVVNVALEKRLGEVPEPDKVAILVRELAQAQRRPVSAVLRCAESQRGGIDDYLSSSGMTYWQTQADPQLQEDELILETDAGQFCCSWSSLYQVLAIAPSD